MASLDDPGIVSRRLRLPSTAHQLAMTARRGPGHRNLAEDELHPVQALNQATEEERDMLTRALGRLYPDTDPPGQS